METEVMSVGKLYIQLRLKQALRLSKGIGALRSLFLLAAAGALFYLLIQTDNRWVISAGVCLGLLLYHNERKDKFFLYLQARHPGTLLRMEYFLLASPFLFIESLKGAFIEAVGMLMFIVCLPGLRTIRWKSVCMLPLPFLYRGGLEYLRMFRRYGWGYLLLLLIAVLGAVNGNVRVAKVTFMLWGIIQGVAFTCIPRREELVHFLDYASFQKYLLCSGGWNQTVTALPFAGIILCLAPMGSSIGFILSVMLATFCYLWNLGMTRRICRSQVGLTVYQWAVLVPLFFYTCFIPLLLLPFLVFDAGLAVFVKHKLRSVWS